MGACLSRPSPKEHKRKRRKKETEAYHEEASDPPEQEKAALPCKASEENDRSEFKEVVPSKHAMASSSPISTEKAAQTFSAVSLKSFTDAVDSQLSHRSPGALTRPPTQKLCPPLVLSPDSVAIPQSALTLARKHSGEYPVNPVRKPSSPCKALLLKLPSSPGGIKKSTSLHGNDEDDCKFPSLARKQWLSQAYITKASAQDDTLPMRRAAEEVEDGSKHKMSSIRGVPTLKGMETSNGVSKVLGAQTSNRLPVAEVSNGITKTATSRTNSLSRDLSPVEFSRPKARPSSPLKRTPSIKEHTGATDGSSRLIRSSSGKVSSPNRIGYQTGERHDLSKARLLHKQSLSKEFISDPVSDLLAHKRSSSKDSVSEYSAEIIRKPSPPKKAGLVVPTSLTSSSFEGGKLNAKRPSTPTKENLYSISSHKMLMQESSSFTTGGKVTAQRRLNTAVHETENLAISNNKNGKSSQKSPLKRTCNVTATRNNDRVTDSSINSDVMSAAQNAPVAKDTLVRARKPASRIPLREISENSVKSCPPKQGMKENFGAGLKVADVVVHGSKGGKSTKDTQQCEGPTKDRGPGKTDEQVVSNFPNTLSSYVKDPLEVKAESLVRGGKSVLSAFKALEEYRSKHSNLNYDSHRGTEDDLWYSRPQNQLPDKDNFSQPLQGSKGGSTLPKSHCLKTQELPRSRSSKRSCEQFIFPDVQSLITSGNEGFQLEGGMTMPASLSKACSILKAVADLNMGTSTYSKKEEIHDEIEHPNLLSFQFGDGDSDRVTSS